MYNIIDSLEEMGWEVSLSQSTVGYDRYIIAKKGGKRVTIEYIPQADKFYIRTSGLVVSVDAELYIPEDIEKICSCFSLLERKG